MNCNDDDSETNNNDTALLRGLFAGSGYDGIATTEMADAILSLLPEPAKHRLEQNPGSVNIVYLGTAMYDLPVSRDKHIGVFCDRGLSVECLDVALDDDNSNNNNSKLQRRAELLLEIADVLVVSCGNTLFAVDRWKHLGLVPLLKAAADRGCVLTGGSAGAICWFDSGHSDSADPDTYVDPMLRKAAEAEAVAVASKTSNNTSNGDMGKLSEFDASDPKEWNYLRVPGLGILPGRLICCPHHDKVQSNGVLRADDFDAMLQRRAAKVLELMPGSSNTSTKDVVVVPHVVGIGIDHYAAWIVEGDRYRVFALPGKTGSVGEDSATESKSEATTTTTFAVDATGTATGTPGVWIKRVVATATATETTMNNGNNSNDDQTQTQTQTQHELVVTAALCPPEGSLSELLGGDENENRPWFGSTFEEDDEEENAIQLERCRKENPVVRMSR